MERKLNKDQQKLDAVAALVLQMVILHALVSSGITNKEEVAKITRSLVDDFWKRNEDNLDVILAD